jgi:hypothetical protein
VNLDIVWQVVDRDLPALRGQVEATLRAQGWGQPPSVSERSRPYVAAWEFTAAAERVASHPARSGGEYVRAPR